MDLKTLQPTIVELKKTDQETLPIILKDKILLSPGNWNGLDFSEESIAKAFEMTDWKNKDNFALIYDHKEEASQWLGNVINIKLQNGSLIGDLEIYDEDLARKLTQGGAKLGISARVLGVETDEGEFSEFTFNNFSVVYDPACKTAYINLSKEGGITTSGSVAGKSVGKDTEEKEEELSNLLLIERRSQKMPEEEIKKEEKVEATTEEPAKESEELSAKITLILSDMKTLSERAAKLEEEEKAEEPKEEPKEEPVEESKEEPKEEEAEGSELAQIKQEVKELQEAREDVNAKSIVKLEAPKSVRGYTDAEVAFATQLLEQSK